MTLEKTAALVAGLAQALGLAALPADDDGGIPLAIGDETLFLYGGDDETILVVAPLAPLPTGPDYGTMIYLLRQNLFDSDTMPFQIAVDEEGMLVFWGRLRLADLDGPALAGLVGNVALRTKAIRTEVSGG